MATSADHAFVLAAMKRVQAWVEEHGYRGYEPFDGLTSYLRVFTFGTRIGEVLLQQLGRQSPINLRPLIGVKPLDSSKGRGYIAWGHLLRFAVRGNPDDRIKAELSLDWLDRHTSPKYAKHSWGNAFDYSSRSGRIPRDESLIVWTALITQAFLEGFEQTGNERWLKVADSACSWMLDLPRHETSTGTCLAYDFNQFAFVHNANMLGAAALARTAWHTGDQTYLRVAQSAMEYSCRRQNPDGAWYYGEKPMYHWIDNFHTGYNLDSLKRYIRYSGESAWNETLWKGLAYFKNHFIEEDGCPRYYHNRRQPIDIQGAAQIIDTLAFLSEEDPSCLELSLRVARWTVDNMQDRDGHFYYRRYPAITVKTPMFHWGQATMFKALAQLSVKLEAAASEGRASSGRDLAAPWSVARP